MDPWTLRVWVAEIPVPQICSYGRRAICFPREATIGDRARVDPGSDNNMGRAFKVPTVGFIQHFWCCSSTPNGPNAEVAYNVCPQCLCRTYLRASYMLFRYLRPWTIDCNLKLVEQFGLAFDDRDVNGVEI